VIQLVLFPVFFAPMQPVFQERFLLIRYGFGTHRTGITDFDVDAQSR
jgi:hypothetical protein